MTRACSKCGRTDQQFSRRTDSVDGYRRQCKACRSRRLKPYSLSSESFNFLKESQDHKCAICRKSAKLVVDHCHRSGKVRGLLCDSCNKGLGFLKDSPQMLTEALKYLDKHK